MIVSTLLFDLIDVVPGFEYLSLAIKWTYMIGVYYGSMVFDLWLMYFDVTGIFDGWDTATFGNILGFFVRYSFNPVM